MPRTYTQSSSPESELKSYRQVTTVLVPSALSPDISTRSCCRPRITHPQHRTHQPAPTASGAAWQRVVTMRLCAGCRLPPRIVILNQMRTNAGPIQDSPDSAVVSDAPPPTIPERACSPSSQLPVQHEPEPVIELSARSTPYATTVAPPHHVNDIYRVVSPALTTPFALCAPTRTTDLSSPLARNANQPRDNAIAVPDTPPRPARTRPAYQRWHPRRHLPPHHRLVRTVNTVRAVPVGPSCDVDDGQTRTAPTPSHPAEEEQTGQPARIPGVHPAPFLYACSPSSADLSQAATLRFHRTQYPTLSAATLYSNGCPCTKSPVPSAPPVCLYRPRACNTIAIAHRLDRADNSIIVALDVRPERRSPGPQPRPGRGQQSPPAVRTADAVAQTSSQPLFCGGKPSCVDRIARSAPNALGFTVPRGVLKMRTLRRFRCGRKSIPSPHVIPACQGCKIRLSGGCRTRKRRLSRSSGTDGRSGNQGLARALGRYPEDQMGVPAASPVRRPQNKLWIAVCEYAFREDTKPSGIWSFRPISWPPDENIVPHLMRASDGHGTERIVIYCTFRTERTWFRRLRTIFGIAHFRANSLRPKGAVLKSRIPASPSALSLPWYLEDEMGVLAALLVWRPRNELQTVRDGNHTLWANAKRFEIRSFRPVSWLPDDNIVPRLVYACGGLGNNSYCCLCAVAGGGRDLEEGIFAMSAFRCGYYIAIRVQETFMASEDTGGQDSTTK
ncbi:hypothetical protein BD310DRAFT_910633 [Dichomitus squalens]|uniref:Uncharacterized protein n=1 Tax=Dichomitus squalens TaxID=114155 RepID=A0A4Q9P9Z5_9APHY|nr:hypothetical protein BD310DRAFT_910633 [Dichomitus squalens]